MKEYMQETCLSWKSPSGDMQLMGSSHSCTKLAIEHLMLPRQVQ